MFGLAQRLDYRVREQLGAAALAFADIYDRSWAVRTGRVLPRLFPSIEPRVDALRLVRKNQADAAQESLSASTLPESLRIRLLGFCLFEVFTEEDFRRLERSVNFFPVESLMASMLKRGRRVIHEDESDLLRSQVPGGIIVRDRSLLTPRAFMRVLKENQFGHFLMPSKVIKTLPEEIFFIRVAPFQVLPSLYAISFYVHLTSQARDELLKIHTSRYSAPFVLTGLSPEEIVQASPTTFDCDVLRKREIQQWKERLRIEVEAALRPFVSGYFSTLTKKGRLPAIDVYSLSGGPPITDAMDDWKPFYDWTSSLTTLGWCDSLGVDFVFGETYLSKLAHFQYGTDLSDGKRPISQLVLWEEPLKEKLTEEAATQNFFNQSGSALSVAGSDSSMEYACKMLAAMMPGLVVVRVLQGLQMSIGQLRLLAFSRLNKRFSLRSGFRLINRITREALLLDRIAGEFKKDSFWPIGFFDLTIFDVRRLRKSGSLDEDFTTDTEKRILERTGLLKNSSTQVQKWLTESLSLQNTKAVYWLSVIAAFVGMVSLLSGWESLIKLASKIIHLFSRLLLNG